MIFKSKKNDKEEIQLDLENLPQHIGIILDGIGNWVKVAVVNKVEKRFVKLHDRIREVTDIDWEEVQ